MATSVVREFSPFDSAAGFLSERQDFLYVYAAPSEGDGWDVVMRIDGTYFDEASAKVAAEGMRQWINGLKDVDKRNRAWWRGAPWKVGRARYAMRRASGRD